MRSVALICLTLLFFIPINKEESAFTNSPTIWSKSVIRNSRTLNFEF